MKPNDTPAPADDPEANNATGAGCISRLVVGSSDTPETDASVNRVEKNGISPIIEYCYANDARRIERERDAAIDALKKWDAACKAADDCNSEMNSESYCQPLWEAFEKIHSQLLEEADRARIAVLSNLSDNA